MMCSAVASDSDPLMTSTDMKAVGLVDSHAYSLLGAMTVTDSEGSSIKLVKVRNPWGRREW